MMPTVKVNGIELAYELSGDPLGRPLVLIQGLVTQLVGWPDEFCRLLADAGHRIIRFDNRDVGLSSKLDHLGVPDLDATTSAAAAGKPLSAPYSLTDMAADTVGLMDVLGIQAAHVAGVSMGGMIAQITAIDYPKRVSSLIVMQSTTGEPDLLGPTPVAMEALMSTPPADRRAYLEYMVGVGRAFSGGSAYFDADVQRELTRRALARSGYLMGFARQLAAIQAAPGRRQSLTALKLPALVIHGACDPLVLPEHGRDVARTIPGSRLLELDGLGHGMAYPELWPAMTATIADVTAV
jgi:pimeloyl-ACP methyl ester carboxylesterase